MVKSEIIELAGSDLQGHWQKTRIQAKAHTRSPAHTRQDL